MTIAPAIYNTQSNIVFVLLVNTCPSTVIPQVLKAAQIADILWQYDADTALYTDYDMTDKALKSLLVAAVDKTYIQSLQDKYIGYANVTTKEMLAYLYLAYAKISDGDLEDNDKRTRADYDVNQPMEVLIEKIDNVMDIAAAADNPYSVYQVVTAAYNLLFKTGMFADDCKMWRRRDPADKTWPYFKTYLTVTHQEIRESQKTSQGAGYHSTNNATMENLRQDIQQETVDAISNLATATAADRAIFETPTATKSQLLKEIIAVNQNLVKLVEEKQFASQIHRWGPRRRSQRTQDKGPLLLFLLWLRRVASQPHLLEQKARAQGRLH